MMRRRQLLVALGAGAVAVPLASFAQQQGKVWRVGFLSARRRPASLDTDYYGAFPRGMRDLGYVEGKNLAIEWRFAEGEYERLPAGGELCSESGRHHGSGTAAIVAAQSYHHHSHRGRNQVDRSARVRQKPGAPARVCQSWRGPGQHTGLSNLVAISSSKHTGDLLAKSRMRRSLAVAGR